MKLRWYVEEEWRVTGDINWDGETFMCPQLVESEPVLQYWDDQLQLWEEIPVERVLVNTKEDPRY
jgi:hypothetical protein